MRVKDQRYLYIRNGVYYFRRSVPAKARSAFGKSEVLKSLDTSKIAEARLLAAVELSTFEKLLARASGAHQPTVAVTVEQQRAPSKGEIDVAVRKWLSARISRVADVDYGGEGRLADGKAQVADIAAHSRDVQRGNTLYATEPSLTTQWIADYLVERESWLVEQGDNMHRYLMRTVARGQVEAAARQRQDLLGEPSVVTDATFAADQYLRDEHRATLDQPVASVSLTNLFEAYVAERQPADATVKAWRRQISTFKKFLGHDDAAKVTVHDILAWKDSLLLTPNAAGKMRSPKTVSHTYVAAVRTLFQWATNQFKLAHNPATKVRVTIPKKDKLRGSGLSDAEAGAILRATYDLPPTGLTAERALARR